MVHIHTKQIVLIVVKPYLMHYSQCYVKYIIRCKIDVYFSLFDTFWLRKKKLVKYIYLWLCFYLPLPVRHWRAHLGSIQSIFHKWTIRINYKNTLAIAQQQLISTSLKLTPCFLYFTLFYFYQFSQKNKVIQKDKPIRVQSE